jgi:hypothetical protein
MEKNPNGYVVMKYLSKNEPRKRVVSVRRVTPPRPIGYVMVR